MKIKNYHLATSLQDAYEVLTESRNNAIVAGGGWLKLSSRTIEKAVDLSDLPLDYIKETDNAVEIGSMTPLQKIVESEALMKICKGILPQAVSQIMGVSLRNLVTVGGSVVGKYGFSDVLTPLLAMNTKLVFYKQGETTLPEFLSQKGRTDDVLEKVVLPKTAGTGYFKKVAKTPLDFAVLNVAITKIDDQYRIVLGSRPSVATLSEEAMAYVNGKKSLRDEDLEHAAKLVRKNVKFGQNPRASQEYREELAYVYTKRGLKEVRDCES